MRSCNLRKKVPGLGVDRSPSQPETTTRWTLVASPLGTRAHHGNSFNGFNAAGLVELTKLRLKPIEAVVQSYKRDFAPALVGNVGTVLPQGENLQ